MTPKVRNLQTEILSDEVYKLKKISYEISKDDGTWSSQTREAYDRGNAATILLYNQEEKTVILTRQFRLPSYINGNETGLLIEACAGMVDEIDPEDRIIKEVQEETGYEISHVEKIFEAYMSPGAVTEIIYFFIGAYTKDMKTSAGGGLEEEQENIEVLEMPFEKAIGMMNSGEIKDAKTIILLQYMQLKQILD
jgi:GDP-mannose pyrophosphatase NudK